MKKIVYTMICSMLFCSACSDSDTGPDPSEQAKERIDRSFFQCMVVSALQQQ